MALIVLKEEANVGPETPKPGGSLRVEPMDGIFLLLVVEVAVLCASSTSIARRSTMRSPVLRAAINGCMRDNIPKTIF